MDSPSTEPGTDPDVEADGEQSLRTLPDFLIDVALLTDADNTDPNDTDRVSLMTVHSSKGLEFPYVYVVGMEENLFPNMMAVQSRADLEEERRLFYVAIAGGKTRHVELCDQPLQMGHLAKCGTQPLLAGDRPEVPPASQPPRNAVRWLSGQETVLR